MERWFGLDEIFVGCDAVVDELFSPQLCRNDVGSLHSTFWLRPHPSPPPEQYPTCFVDRSNWHAPEAQINTTAAE